MNVIFPWIIYETDENFELKLINLETFYYLMQINATPKTLLCNFR